MAVASGKGGTGKTTVAVNLASVLNAPVQVLDCDVEEPNAGLFLRGRLRGTHTVAIPVPEVDESLCDACGACSRFCQYHAIVTLKKALVFPDLCHACGGCVRVCPRQAIREIDHRIGTVEVTERGMLTLVTGRIDVGVAMAPPLIRAVKKYIRENDFCIMDAPPGTSCPVIAAVNGSDFVILVTEPTPFGLNDLRLAVDMVQELNIPFGVVVNRFGVGDDRVHRFCGDNGIPVLVEIPDDRRIAEAYSRGGLLVEAVPEYRGLFERLWKAVQES
ncbi:ATP-binding protein [bacterium]|nr:ATP-binding protein [bacterium]